MIMNVQQKGEENLYVPVDQQITTENHSFRAVEQIWTEVRISCRLEKKFLRGADEKKFHQVLNVQTSFLLKTFILNN